MLGSSFLKHHPYISPCAKWLWNGIGEIPYCQNLIQS